VYACVEINSVKKISVYTTHTLLYITCNLLKQFLKYGNTSRNTQHRNMLH
jgi:hypothetical protein